MQFSTTLVATILLATSALAQNTAAAQNTAVAQSTTSEVGTCTLAKGGAGACFINTSGGTQGCSGSTPCPKEGSACNTADETGIADCSGPGFAKREAVQFRARFRRTFHA